MNSPHEFARLLAAVRALEASRFSQPAALATITRTWGSTFRRAGTSMLVAGDGGVVCALSGGCPQRDIVLRAQGVIADRRSRLVRYNRESGLDVLIEMGCGGELEVLVEPLARPEDTRFLDAVAALHEARVPGVLATAFARDGDALPQPQRLVASERGEWNGVGDAPLAEAIRGELARVGAGARAEVRALTLPAGVTEVLFERLAPVHALTAVGINAASLALARIAHGLGWQVTLVDGAEPPPETAALAGSVRVVRAAPEALPAAATLDAFAAVVVMTFNVERDVAYLAALAHAPLAYLGAIGSRERAGRMRDAVASANLRVFAPAGLDVGAETPEEIAVAVVAEILASFNARSGGRLSDTQVPIHA